MTIDEAIETLSGDTSDLTIFEVPFFLDAIKLGTEALKAVQAERTGKIVDYRHPLPGETPTTDTKRSFHHIKENLQGIGEHP